MRPSARALQWRPSNRHESEKFPISYWLSLIRSDLKHFGKRGRLIAMARGIWRVVWHHDNVQSCNECNRRYLVWIGADDLYTRVHGNRGGGYCPMCFHARAKAKGVDLIWVPMIWRENGVDSMSEIAKRIGAFQ
jgi:hypothetical protein